MNSLCSKGLLCCADRNEGVQFLIKFRVIKIDSDVKTLFHIWFVYFIS